MVPTTVSKINQSALLSSCFKHATWIICMDEERDNVPKKTLITGGTCSVHIFRPGDHPKELVSITEVDHGRKRNRSITEC